MNTSVNNIWQKSKVLVKGLVVGFIALLLLIPTQFVKDLIQEREHRQREAFDEVSSKWAGSQNITGPVLVIPYQVYTKDEKGVVITSKQHAYFLPDQLKMDATLKPEKRHRGIFEVLLYTAQANIQGSFQALPITKLGIPAENMLWNEAYICLNIGDSKGLKEEIKIKWNDSTLVLSPTVINNAVMKDGFVAPVKVDESSTYQFASTYSFNGSERLLFTPTGKETNVTLSSTWPDPSFTGGMLPDHQISDSGFVANWKSLAHTRTFPQAWTDNAYDLSTASFGTDLFIPVNGYQKTMRSVKYAALCILLTFAAFFIIETVNRRIVHPLHYALIGLALVLFYTLLLSFSEYIGFNGSYIVATVATVGLIAWFVKDLLQSSRLTVILSILLAFMYAYVFTLLQLQDYSLLLGSIGLFITLAVIMHFSKKIQW